MYEYPKLITTKI